MKNLASLNKLVLVLFTEDKTVVPKESAWFGSEEVPTEFRNEQRVILGSPAKVIVPIHSQPLYQEDWIGLRQLDEKGGVVFETCVGEHMQMGDCWKQLVQEYVGSS